MIPVARPALGVEEREAVAAVLESGQLAQGPQVAAFEERFAARCGVRHAVAVCNGTAALHTALAGLDIGPGDEVITTPFTFVATANAVLMQGATLRFADINPETFTIDPAAVEEALTPQTKAVIAVDLYGHPFSERLNALAEQHGFALIEDACQAVGATRNGTAAGALGSVGTFSFYATKNITTGEGGMLTTDDEKLAAFARRFRHHGQGDRYEYEAMGYNYRLTDIQAAIGLAQLEKLDDWTATRCDHAQLLSQGLADVPGLILPTEQRGCRHVYHQYTVRVTPDFACSRDELKERLAAREVGSAVFYPKPLHLHPHFARLGYARGAFPESERAAEEVLSLPVHPSLKREDMMRVIAALQEVAGC